MACFVRLAHRPPRRWSKLYIWTKRRWQLKVPFTPCISQNVTRRRTRRRAWRWAPSASSLVMLAPNKPALWLAVGDDACLDTPTDFTAAAQAWGTTSLDAEPPWVLNLVPRLRDPSNPNSLSHHNPTPDLADLSDAAVCAAWADGMKCTGWMRRPCPNSNDCPAGCLFLAGEDPYFHYEDSSEINCGETYTCTLDDTGRGVHHRGERRVGRSLVFLSSRTRPPACTRPRVHHLQDGVARERVQKHGFLNAQVGGLMCQPGMLLEREWRGSCEPNLAHQLHQVFKARAPTSSPSLTKTPSPPSTGSTTRTR